MNGVSLAPSDMRAWAATPTGKKAVRYTLVSVISVAVSQAVLFLTFGVLQLASAVPCNIIATAVATVPSYYLNRRWAWGKTGPSHLWKEIVPFWGLAFLGLVLSILLIYLAIVVNFQSWLDPFIIITALPAALAGIVWMLFLTHTTVSVPALTGAIMCMGVATANSVLIVSFARERLDAGDLLRLERRMQYRIGQQGVRLTNCFCTNS